MSRDPEWIEVSDRPLYPIEATASDECPDCGGDLEHHTAEQDALFVHGGYGATARTVISRCPSCGWSLQREKSEIRPPRTNGASDG